MTRSFKKADRPVLISIRPQFAEKILAGEKLLEFRRAWASCVVDALVIYASSPRREIVAIAKVADVHEGSPTALWELTREKAGGISRRQLYAYFRGRRSGYAIEISSVLRTNGGLNPRLLFHDFSPPQSFHYLGAEAYAKVIEASKHRS
jgi:predicted transcriptional regulator